MKLNVLIYLMISLMVSCRPQSQKEIEKIPDKNKFSYQERKTFFKLDIDSVAEGKYKKLDSADFFKLFRGTGFEKYYYGEYPQNFLYNVQNSSDTLDAITVIIVEDSYYYYLKYLTFNGDGQPIDSLDIAGFGGDGGFGFEAYGKFINDSVYQRVWINISNTEDSISGEWIGAKDTIITKHIFRKNGTIN